MIFELRPTKGQGILGYAKEAIGIADKLSIAVSFDFTGVACHVSPGDNAELLRENYLYAFRNGEKAAFARPLPKPKEPELLPCPFCGGPAEFVEYDIGDCNPKTVYGVTCQTKGCWTYEGTDAWLDTEDEAARLWNNRKGEE